MNNISIGDEVIVHEPSNHYEYPMWVADMDKYVWKVMLVEFIDEPDETVRLCGAGHYYFNISWLEQRVTTDDNFDTEVGSLYE